jgi:NitT/TauT family transport system ATP-binding protein
MLEIARLTKKFGQEAEKRRNEITVLDNVSFEVPQNDFVCLLGPSGCGKTTLLRIVTGLTRPDAGTIRIDGQLVERPGPERSLVFQNYGLLPWRTVLGNVELGLEIRGMKRSERREICRRTIKRVGLSGFEQHYPHQLSGGMQQRTALARAFSKDPKILLMDEPFAAVDMQTREMLQDELLRIWNSMRTTVLFVTHSIDEAIYLGDRVIVMGAHPGRVIADLRTDLPRPRASSDVKVSQRFDELRRLVRAALAQGSVQTLQ